MNGDLLSIARAAVRGLGEPVLDEDQQGGLLRDLIEVGEGIALLAPESVDLSASARLALLLCARFSGLRQWEGAPRYNVGLVAVDVHGGFVAAAPALLPKKMRTAFFPRPAPPREPPPNAMMAAARLAGAFFIEAREVLALPWIPSRLALTILFRDWTSNTVLVDLVGAPGAAPALPAPRFVLRGTRPVAAPAGPGIHLRGDEAARAGHPWKMEATLAIPPNGEAPWIHEDAREAIRGRRSLACALVVMRHDDPQPRAVPLEIEVEHQPDDDGGVRVAFAAELDAGEVALDAPGAYHVRLFCGPLVSEPVGVEVA